MKFLLQTIFISLYTTIMYIPIALGLLWTIGAFFHGDYDLSGGCLVAALLFWLNNKELYN